MAQVQAHALEHNQVIVDPEGNHATVIRVRWMDHKRCRLETDLGVATVPLTQKFEIVEP